MSNKLDRLAYEFENLGDVLTAWTKENVRNNEEYFVRSVQNNLYDGFDGLGQSLGEYAPMTIAYKQSVGQPYDHVTLRDSGLFYNSMELEEQEDSFSIVARDLKTLALNIKYGEDITTISQIDIDNYIQEELIPFLQDVIKEKVLL